MKSRPQKQPYDLQNAVTKNKLRGIWRLMTGYHWLFVLASLGLGLSALARTGLMLVLRAFVDRLVEKDFSSSLIWLVVGFIGLAIGHALFSFVSSSLAARTAESVVRRLRNYVFDHIQRLPFAYHANAKTGDLLERATSDVDAIRRFCADHATGIGQIFFMFTINFVALLNMNVKLALISVIAIPIILVTSLFFFKIVSKAYDAYQAQEAILSTTLQENLTGVRVVKAFARQNYESYKFDQDNWEKYKRGKRLLTMHSLFWPLSDILCGAQMLTGFAVGAIMAINNEITIGTYLAYAGIIVWIIWPMRNLGRLIVNTSTGLVSYSRVAEILKETRESLVDGEHQPEGMVNGDIAFNDVSFEYEKDKPVITNINFHVKAGHSVALLGSTGSGKTSLVNLLPRFYDTTSGEILLDGVDIKRYRRDYLRSMIGIVEQEPFLFSCSIRDNITYGIHEAVSQEKLEEAARSASIHDVIMDFPDGYNTLVGERGVTLSGGQKQRVAIARALLKNPKILILDDSTSSVDMETEAQIRQALNNLMENRTTFIIAHRIQSIMNADLIIVFDKGKIIQMGTHADLLSQPGMYQEIYNIQTRIDDELEKEIASVNNI